MKLDQNRVNRWTKLLANVGDPDIRPENAIQIALDVSRGQHRRRIVACLEAVAAIRRGATFQCSDALPDVPHPALAVHGNMLVEATWTAYLQFCLGSKDAAHWLAAFVRTLSPTAFLAAKDDNLEQWWANELLMLHSLQSFVFLSDDSKLQEELNGCMNFHLLEIQPDHATNEPWAVHAFAMYEKYPDGNMTAESLLHAAMVYGGGTLTDVAKLIVADARHTLAVAANRE